MKFFKYFLIFFIICTIIFLLFAYWPKKIEYQFPEISSYKDLNLEIQNPNNTIIFFDIDDTIITADDSFIQDKYSISFILKQIIKHPKLIWRKNWEYYFSIIWQNLKWKKSDEYVVKFMDNLKKMGCLLVALTAMETGSFGNISSMPEWRFQKLKKLNIEFTQNLPNIKFECLAKYRNNYPELYKGILCCNQVDKGKVVEAFLECFKLKPEKIIFFEDGIENLNSVAKICGIKKIKFKGYSFQLINKKKWNQNMAEFKLDYLIRNNIWLLDDDIKCH